MRFENLDALRGILALLVAGSHGYTIFIRGIEKDFGHYAVVILARFSVLAFFVLSGFVIAHSIHRNIERHGTFDWRDYARARAARILPPLAISILLTLALGRMLSAYGLIDLPAGVVSERSSFRVDWLSQLSSLFTLGTFGHLSGGLNGPLWSLTYEMQLYAMAGLLAVGARWLTVLFAAVLLWRIEALQVVCFLAFLSGSIASWVRDRSSWPWVAGFAAAGILWLMVSDLDNLDTSWPALAGQVLFGASFAAFIAIMSRGSALRAIGFTGAFSYTLYIIHFPVLLFVFFILQPVAHPWVACMAGVAGCVVLAAMIAPWAENTRPWKRA